MSQTSPTELSLGTVIDDVFGNHQQVTPLETLFRRESQLVKIILDPALTEKFKGALSPMQLASFESLHAWTCVRSWDKTFDSAAVDASVVMLGLLDGKDETFLGFALDDYHLQLTKLWYAELNPLSRHNLHTYRLSAIYLVSCHVLAQICYQSIETPMSDLREMDIRTLLKRRSLFPREHCTWLKQQPRQAGMPFYLWDVKNERTRTVKEIAEESGRLPDYVAVSHTWGRWKKESEPWISLPGVPWQIPQNSKFKVQDLPAILQVLPFEYVWLDLLTIPQQELNPSMAELQKTEIARQASIFRHAVVALAWLNDVKSWNGTQAALNWLCLGFLMKLKLSGENGSPLDADAVRQRAFEAANAPTEFCETSGSNSYNRQPNAWFTSLWTLQEICLRPDMIPCNEQWEPVTVSNHVAVSFIDMIALCCATSEILASIRVPKGVQQLVLMLDEIEMMNLLNLSQAKILTLGNRRYCRKRRAEAIMSAIGVTDWFQSCTTESRERELVLHRYPLPFVNETRVKLGACFFTSAPSPVSEFYDILDRICGESMTYTGQLEPMGSLLPFGLSAHTLDLKLDVASASAASHPAVKSWIIEESGCVRISEAGIVTSTVSENLFGESCKIIGPLPEDRWRRIGTRNGINLDDWVRSYKPEMRNFAVCTVYNSIFISGIILKEVGPGVFIRVAMFSAFAPTGRTLMVPQSQQVNWLVL